MSFCFDLTLARYQEVILLHLIVVALLADILLCKLNTALGFYSIFFVVCASFNRFIFVLLVFCVLLSILTYFSMFLHSFVAFIYFTFCVLRQCFYLFHIILPYTAL